MRLGARIHRLRTLGEAPPTARDVFRLPPAPLREAPPTTHELAPGVLEQFPVLNATILGHPVRSIVMLLVVQFVVIAGVRYAIETVKKQVKRG